MPEFNNLSSEFGRFFNYRDKEPIENYTKANVTIQNSSINKNKRKYSMEMVKENLLKRNELLKNNSFVYENRFDGFEPGKIVDFNNGLSLYTMCVYPRGYGRLSLPLFLYKNTNYYYFDEITRFEDFLEKTKYKIFHYKFKKEDIKYTIKTINYFRILRKFIFLRSNTIYGTGKDL